MYTRCDVASSGRYEYQAIGNFFPRVDINPDGVWVVGDCHTDGTVFIRTSAGEQHELGPRAPDNPICVRWLPERAVFKVAWVNGYAQGQTIDVNGLGQRIPDSEGMFDASGAGSQGIRDIDEHGTIYFKDATDYRVVDGVELLHWRERGDYVVGVCLHTWLGVSVFVHSTATWYRAYPHHVDLLPGIGDNGTVAASGADPGGFITLADWMTRPFDPHATTPPEPIDPPIDPIDPPDPPDPPDPVDPTEPIDPIKPPPVTSQVRHALLMFEDGFVEVYERTHQDHGQNGRPYLALQSIDGRVLAANADTGTLEWRDPGTVPGVWERFISVPGGYAILRDGYVGLVARAAWLEDD